MTENCSRCGYCCVAYLNVVVSPKYADLEEIDFNNPNNPDDMFLGLGADISKCPHVYWDEEKDCAICKVHDKSWFKNTPCFQHRFEEKCRIGQYIMSDPERKQKHKEKYF